LQNYINKPNPRTIIINADDFGKNQTRNIAIDTCMKSGIVTQTSIMVNMGSYTSQAAEMAKNGGYFDKVCLHLNLTEGTPLTESIKHTPMCNNGNFVGMKNVYFMLRNYMNSNCRKAIHDECKAQIEKYIELGFDPIHIDSHNWIHLYLPIWFELRPLLNEYGFKTVRPMRKGLRSIRSMHSVRSIFNRVYYFITWVIMSFDCHVPKMWSSGLEEFTYYYHSKQIAEVFCHPDIIDNEIYDCTYSYRNEPYKKITYFEKNLSGLKNRSTYFDYFKD
jgi:predicted glycoside hydrolase/deacetylase ChbG (UPF0249 family)